MIRKITDQVKGYRTQDGAGVSLVRVLGRETVKTYDPFLMLDAFDSEDPEDYIKGFPMHPHRGIETFTFLSKGSIVHEDHLGNKEAISDGEAQWLTAGSGAFHSEMPQPSERMLGIQLWLNIPAADKMKAPPFYHGVTRPEIPEIDLGYGTLRLMAGSYKGNSSIIGKYLPLDFYDIRLDPGSEFRIETDPERSAMVFTLSGDAEVSGTKVAEKNAAKLGGGDEVIIRSLNDPIEILFISSRSINEPVAWYGPVVMNTDEELRQAINELNNGTFIKEDTEY